MGSGSGAAWCLLRIRQHGFKSRNNAVWVGIDVGGRELAVTIARGTSEPGELKIPDSPEGFAIPVRAIKHKGGTPKVVLEETGTYHLDLALRLTGGKITVVVVNPMAARRFAQAQMRCAKTDRVDALALLEFCHRLPFEPWQAPSRAILELPSLARRLPGLVADPTAIKNRITACRATETTPAFILTDLEAELVLMG